MLIGEYSPLLVFLSLIVAIVASYTALDMAGRISNVRGRAAKYWLAGGASAMGLGIWSMHFVGMLAFSLPIPLGYDPWITLMSLLIAIAFSAYSLHLVCQERLPWQKLAVGALLMGAGVAGMHYTGMIAMRMAPGIAYDPALFALSILIAVLASGAALWIAFNLRHNTTRVRRMRLLGAVVMGIAIVGMHYTGMAAANFPLGSICGAFAGGLSPEWLALFIITVTMSVMGTALLVSLQDLRLETTTSTLSSSLVKANEELTYLALHDNLTKLANRLLLDDRLKQALRTARRDKDLTFALMFLDLDGFKAINDVYGHHVGDLLLIEVAQRIRGALREEDTVARMGGDEFVILALNMDPASAGRLAEDLIEAIREPFRIDIHQLAISLSIGIAIYPNDGIDQDDLLTNADAAMYHAKGMGRDTYCFFQSSMNANVHRQLQLVQDMRRALENSELRLHYQPVHGARWSHHRRRGAGALAASHAGPVDAGRVHPHRGEDRTGDSAGQVGAERSLPATGGLAPGTRYSLERGGQPVGGAVRSSDLVGTVSDVLRRHGLDASYLTLEVTESTAMKNADASLAILQQLHEMGVRISIDDFGTGYSSLLYLKRLPATELKIDRGFVRDLEQDTEDAAIVSAIIALGNALKVQVVAEGVETPEQREFLTELGCHSLQGFCWASR